MVKKTSKSALDTATALKELSTVKADLTLLKKYVNELEILLNSVYDIRDSGSNLDDKSNYIDFNLALSKAVGVLFGIGQESSLLIQDLQNVSKSFGAESLSKITDLIKSTSSDFNEPSGGGSKSEVENLMDYIKKSPKKFDN